MKRIHFATLAFASLLQWACAGTEPHTATVATVTLSVESLDLLGGQKRALVATPRDLSGNAIAGAAVTWSSDAESVATVSSSGVVTAVGSGSATITATAGGKSATADVSVTTIDFAYVATGGAHSCALDTDGHAWCWGRSERGQLGVPNPDNECLFANNVSYPCIPYPVEAEGGYAFTSLVGGDRSTCALTAGGTAYCWGGNNAGQLGNNAVGTDFSSMRSFPDTVYTSLRFTMLAGGALHFCGLTSTGAAYCWGNDSKGQLGDGTQINRSAPVAVQGGHTFKWITAGGYTSGVTCGITTDDDAYCWGENAVGLLGTGSADDSAHTAPVLVAGGIKWAELDAALGQHSCGLAIGGAAYCWGANPTGALGDGTILPHFAPAAVAGGLTFTHIKVGGFAGGDHTCALTSTGTAYCWGDNSVGAVGDGTSEQRDAPVAVTGGLTFAQLDAGLRHTCGLTTADIVYCWGSDRTGQVGTDALATGYHLPMKLVGQQ